MNFLTGISLTTWLRIGIVAAFVIQTFAYNHRGDTIDDLRAKLTHERAQHDITRASVVNLEIEIGRQNDAIELARAAQDQARLDLAAAVEASASSVDVIDRLVASSRAAPAGPACEPSAAVRSVWP